MYDTNRIHRNRRHWRMASLATFVAAMLMLVVPAAASAIAMPAPGCSMGECAKTAADYPAFKGWGLVNRMCQSTGFRSLDSARVPMNWTFPGGGACAMNVGPLSAWRWTGSSWAGSTLDNGEWVYIWPWGSGWSWAWTQRTGWVAARSESLVVCADPNSFAPTSVRRCS